MTRFPQPHSKSPRPWSSNIHLLRLAAEQAEGELYNRQLAVAHDACLACGISKPKLTQPFQGHFRFKLLLKPAIFGVSRECPSKTSGSATGSKNTGLASGLRVNGLGKEGGAPSLFMQRPDFEAALPPYARCEFPKTRGPTECRPEIVGRLLQGHSQKGPQFTERAKVLRRLL